MQEAVAVGMEAALTHQDNVITAYRCHGNTYIRGASLESIFAELMGRRDGICRGKGGSMHMFSPSFFGGHGIVGAQVCWLTLQKMPSNCVQRIQHMHEK